MAIRYLIQQVLDVPVGHPPRDTVTRTNSTELLEAHRTLANHRFDIRDTKKSRYATSIGVHSLNTPSTVMAQRSDDPILLNSNHEAGILNAPSGASRPVRRDRSFASCVKI